MKRLEGIKYTEKIHAIVEQALSIEEPPPIASKGDEVSSSTGKSRGRDALDPLEFSAAKMDLVKSGTIPTNGTFPLSSLKSMRSVIISSTSGEEKDCLLKEMEAAVSQSSLVYTAPPPSDEDDKEKKKYSKRMEKLRLRSEEAKYKKLTDNLDTHVADDVTMKSMSYAASVGLNMIVAPISFGVLMYFFAGSLFGWVTGGEEVGPGQTDIKSVIAGVVSGVLMLFIEMTLFVIRSHEMDASIRKKSKTSRMNPFGYNEKRAMKTFNG